MISIFWPLLKCAIAGMEEVGVAGSGEAPVWAVGGGGERGTRRLDGRCEGEVVAPGGCAVGEAGAVETVGVDRNGMPGIQLHDHNNSTTIEIDSHLRKRTVSIHFHSSCASMSPCLAIRSTNPQGHRAYSSNRTERDKRVL